MAGGSADPSGSLRSTAIRSARWVAAEKWGTRILQLVVFAFMARFLDPRDWGLVAFATAIIAVSTLFVDQGFSKALVQRRDLEPEHSDTAFWTGLGLACLMTLAVVALAGPIASALGDDELTGIIRWLSIGIPLSALGSTAAALMERGFQFRLLAYRRLAGVALGGVSGVVCAAAGAGVWSLVVQTIVGAAASTIALWVTSPWRPRLRVSRRHLADLWRFGASVLAIEVTGVVNQYADRFIVGAALGPTALGYYYIGLRVVSLAVESLTAVVATVSLTTFSKMQDDIPRLRTAFYACTRISGLVCIPFFTALAVLAPVLIPVLFGDGWDRSIPVMQVLCGLGIINSVAYFDRSALLALRRERWALGITVGQAALNVVIAIILSPYGIIAVAIGVTVRQYLFWPVRITVLRKVMRLQVGVYLRQWAIPLAATLPLIAIAELTRRVLHDLPDVVALIAAGGLGAAAYVWTLRVAAPAMLGEVLQLVPGRFRPALGGS